MHTVDTPAFTLSDEVAYLKRSVMRDLLKLAVAPDMISLAGGLPAGEFLPIQQYQKCLNFVLERDGAQAMQYSPPYLPLREWIAEDMRRRGVPCDTEQIFITNGNQQGLALLSRLLLDSHGVAVTEAITFTGIQQVTAGRGARVRTVPTDLVTGVDVDALEKIFKHGSHPQVAILIPEFHNPLGVSISAEKRVHIARLAARYGVPIIEDDPYSALRFAGNPLPPIKAYDEAGFVFYLGSFSKMLAPGLRLGWIVAPVELIPKITVLRESIDLESSTLTQRAVYEFVSRGYLEPHLQQMNAVNHERAQAMQDTLSEHLSDIGHWTQPQGGLFVWLTLPENVDTWAMLDEAVEQKVAYIPGSAFAIEGGYHNTMRLNFSNATPEAIHEGIARLSMVIKSKI